MNRLLIISFVTIVAFFGYQNISEAVCTESAPNTYTCDTAPPNPDPTGVQAGDAMANTKVEMLPGSAINTILSEGGNGGDAIATDDDDDMITITDAEIRGEGDGIDTGNGVDMININGSNIYGKSDGIEGITGDFVINIVDSKLVGGTDAITLSSGSSVINVKGSMLEGQSSNGIDSTSSGTCDVTVESSVIDGPQAAIDMRTGDDVLTLKTGADIRNTIDCGSDFDTIVFAMEVPEQFIPEVSQRIATAGLPDGNIIINGLYYSWVDCELLVNEIVPGNPGRVTPIPTLSEWGLIAMAGIIGIGGIIAVRRKASA